MGVKNVIQIEDIRRQQVTKQLSNFSDGFIDHIGDGHELYRMAITVIL